MMLAVLVLGTAPRSPAQCGDVEEGKILAVQNNGPGDKFGGEVDIDGSVAVVTSLFDDAKSTDCGTAYVFRYDPNLDQWIEEQRLRASNRQDYDGFGSNVAVSGNWIAVGAQWVDNGPLTDVGAVYLFEYNGTRWIERQILTPTNGFSGQHFGSCFELDGEVLVVGQYAAAGSIHIYRQDPVSLTWNLEVMIPDPNGNTWFGLSPVVEGNLIVVGALTDSTAAFQAGAAFVYRFDGVQWNLDQQLLASDAAARDGFGADLAIRNDRILVGAVWDDGPGGIDSGSAYVFRYDGSRWQEEQHLVPTGLAPNDWAGSRVALDDHTAVLGAFYADQGPISNVGALWLYRYDGSTWIEERKLMASDATADDEGGAVALSGDVLMMGVWQDDDHGTDSGSVYVFDVPELGLAASQDVVIPGDTLTLTTFPGRAGQLALLAVIDVTGQPYFHKLDLGTFAADCSRVHLSATVPPGLTGNVVTFQSYGIAMTGRLLATDPVPVTFN